jgi:hypothetical protein
MLPKTSTFKHPVQIKNVKFRPRNSVNGKAASEKMDIFLARFKRAFAQHDGYALAEVITPEAPKEDAGQLYAFHRSSNSFAIQNDLRSGLIYHNDLHLSKGEANAWIDVLSAY